MPTRHVAVPSGRATALPHRSLPSSILLLVSECASARRGRDGKSVCGTSQALARQLSRLWSSAHGRILSLRSDDVCILDRHAEGDCCAPPPPGTFAVRVDSLTCPAPERRLWGLPCRHPASRPQCLLQEFASRILSTGYTSLQQFLWSTHRRIESNVFRRDLRVRPHQYQPEISSRRRWPTLWHTHPVAGDWRNTGERIDFAREVGYILRQLFTC